MEDIKFWDWIVFLLFVCFSGICGGICWGEICDFILLVFVDLLLVVLELGLLSEGNVLFFLNLWIVFWILFFLDNWWYYVGNGLLWGILCLKYMGMLWVLEFVFVCCLCM